LKKPAFTLFELVVVVALIGIIYALVLSNFNTQKDIKIAKLQDLKSTLLPLWKEGNRVELIIYNEFSDAALAINDDINESYKPKIDISKFKNIQYRSIWRAKRDRVCTTYNKRW